jgi:hypothetical protein
MLSELNSVFCPLPSVYEQPPASNHKQGIYVQLVAQFLDPLQIKYIHQV